MFRTLGKAMSKTAFGMQVQSGVLCINLKAKAKSVAKRGDFRVRNKDEERSIGWNQTGKGL